MIIASGEKMNIFHDVIVKTLVLKIVPNTKMDKIAWPITVRKDGEPDVIGVIILRDVDVLKLH